MGREQRRWVVRRGGVRVLSVWAVLAVGPVSARAQVPQAGLEFGGLPAINYDADEGYGYGAVVQLYHYGDGTRAPYLWTLQPTVFLTTGGRRDFTLFFDSPHLLPGGWRLGAFLGSEKQLATPYYGPGNESVYDPSAVTGENPYYYRFGRTLRSATVTVQRPLPGVPVRLLLGAGIIHGSVLSVPYGRGTTYLAEELAAAGAPAPEGWSNYVRVGLVWDTRDRETGPRDGTWTEILIQRFDEVLGSTVGYTRWTFTDRRYFGVGPVVLAHRLLLQNVSRGVPLYDLSAVQSSFKGLEGLGGSQSVRGVLRNRFVGRGILIWNVELRARVLEFGLLGRPFHVVLSAFTDAGRVWEDGIRFRELLSDLHRSYGGGVRVGMGENFVVAVDAGTSAGTGMQLYIGLGYLY